MNKGLIFFFVCIFSITGNSQYSWTWTELSQMPVRTSNNAVCEAIVGGNEYVYSFGGIDSTKLYSGIHQRSFRYNVSTNAWAEIASLPDSLGKIAAGASFVNGKIYIIGGYHVLANSNEISSNKVHVYNPQTDSFEADASPLIKAIDDHVQAVWRDSLIYVITGWSNTTNQPDVQIFNPSLNSWQSGTPTPNSNFFKAFGASGTIIGDTIYYHGGVTTGGFNAQKYVRKGVINPMNPTEIVWSQLPDAPGTAGYRSASSFVGNTAFWVGGAAISYNFNGIAYVGGGVEPSTRILHYNQQENQFVNNTSEPVGIMDLRGIAKFTNNRWIICGGMDSSQVVSNRAFLLSNPSLSTQTISADLFEVQYVPNGVKISSNSFAEAQLIDLNGKVIRSFEANTVFEISRDEFSGFGIFIQGENSTKIWLSR